MKVHVLISVLLYGYILQFIKGQTLNDVKKLYDDIFTGYRKNIVPISNHSKPMEIGFAFTLLAIAEFREVEETIVLTGGLVLHWNDVSLAWNPSSYGNNTFLEVYSSDIWIPWIYLRNNADKMEPFGLDPPFRAYLYPSGNVVLTPGHLFQAKCKTDISRFPLDTQTCQLIFLSWSTESDIYKYTYRSLQSQVNLNFYSENSNWKISKTETFVTINDLYPSFRVVIEIAREPLYYITMIISPTVLLCLLNPMVFLLPEESGGRVSLAVTILLSYAIFLTLVSTAIPSSANPMCYLLVAMIAVMCSSGLIVICTIITSKLYFDTEYIPGKFGTFLINITTCRYRRQKFVIGKKEVKSELATLSGIDLSKSLDMIFLIGFYILLFSFFIVYCIAISF